MLVKIKEGHVVTDGKGDHPPGSTIEVEQKEGKRLIKLGIVREVHKEISAEDILDAISLLDKENPKLWTKNSGPQLDALRDVLNADVSSEQRDEAWKKHQEKIAGDAE